MAQHLAAIEASLTLLQGQVTALKASWAMQERPRATVALQERCAGVLASSCGLQDEEGRLSRRSFSDPQAWNCRGCEYESRSV